MYYLRARYYKPDTGRFWTMDSYEGNNEEPLSLHKYLYTQGNPVNGIDPSGHGDLGELITVTAQIGIFAARSYSVYSNVKCGVQNFVGGMQDLETGLAFMG